MPTIVERLISSAKESKNISKGSVYFTSHKYKLQYTILSGLGDFVLNLNFIESDMYDISNAVAHYLDKDQPIALQVHCHYFCSVFLKNMILCVLIGKIKIFLQNIECKTFRFCMDIFTIVIH